MFRTTIFIFFSLSTFCFGQTDILLTDFQTGIPVSYSIVDNDGFTPNSQVSNFTSAWIALQDPENSSDTVAGSTSFFTPTDVASRWLITPSLSMSSYGNHIEWEAKSHDASFPDDYLVLVSTTDDQLSSFTDTIGYVIEENFEWTTRAVNLSSKGYDNQTIYIAFVNVTDNGFILYVDDIHVWIEDPAAVEELNEELQISVYPNPSNDVINIQSETPIESMILVDSNGSEILNTISKKLDITSLNTGIYFLKITTSEGSVIKKIIKN